MRMSPFSENTKRGTSSQVAFASVEPITFPAYQIPWSIATLLFFLYVRKQTANIVQTIREITIALVAGFLYFEIADTLDLTDTSPKARGHAEMTLLFMPSVKRASE